MEHQHTVRQKYNFFLVVKGFKKCSGFQIGFPNTVETRTLFERTVDIKGWLFDVGGRARRKKGSTCALVVYDMVSFPHGNDIPSQEIHPAFKPKMADRKPVTSLGSREYGLID